MIPSTSLTARERVGAFSVVALVGSVEDDQAVAERDGDLAFAGGSELRAEGLGVELL